MTQLMTQLMTWCMQGLTSLLKMGPGSEELFDTLMTPNDSDEALSSELDIFVEWVWQHTVSSNRYERDACMWLMEHLCEYWKSDTNMGR